MIKSVLFYNRATGKYDLTTLPTTQVGMSVNALVLISSDEVVQEVELYFLVTGPRQFSYIEPFSLAAGEIRDFSYAFLPDLQGNYELKLNLWFGTTLVDSKVFQITAAEIEPSPPSPTPPSGKGKLLAGLGAAGACLLSLVLLATKRRKPL